MARSKPARIAIKPTTPFIPKGVSIPEQPLSDERPGVIRLAAKQPAKKTGAVLPPRNDRPIPTSTVAERMRKRMKRKG